MPPRKQPQDHLPARKDAKREKLTFFFRDWEYTITREAAENVELMELVEDQLYIRAIRGFLGTDQWKQFKDSQRDTDGRVPLEVFQEFMEKIIEVIGGNSSASANSSANTPRR